MVEGEGQDLRGGQEGRQRQVRRGDQVAGREPAGREGGVRGQAEGGGGGVQSHRDQALPGGWRGSWRNARRWVRSHWQRGRPHHLGGRLKIFVKNFQQCVHLGNFSMRCL